MRTNSTLHRTRLSSPVAETFPTCSTDTLESALEAVIRGAVEAVNARNFNATSQPWANFSPEFRNDPDGHVFQQYIAGQSSCARSRSSCRPKNLEQWLSVHRGVARKHPGYRLNVVDCDTTLVNEKVGFAQVMLGLYSTGMPEGVVRSTISAFEFRRLEGQWMCVLLKTLPGMYVSGAGEL